MSKLPNIKKFETPKNYFEQLPEVIMGRVQKKSFFSWMHYAAAAAMIIISLGVWQINFTGNSVQAITLDEEVKLYIDSQYWTVEDILSMSDDADEILDQIIEEEMPFDEDLWLEEQQNWF